MPESPGGSQDYSLLCGRTVGHGAAREVARTLRSGWLEARASAGDALYGVVLQTRFLGLGKHARATLYAGGAPCSYFCAGCTRDLRRANSNGVGARDGPRLEMKPGQRGPWVRGCVGRQDGIPVAV